jgi:hypothetical protein
MTGMAPHVSLVLTWILYIALFPIAFFWLRRAWRIIVKRDFSEVALKRGEAAPNPVRFAPFSALLNIVGGGVVLYVIVAVAAGALEYETWTAIAGATIWCKFFADFALSRHAHGFAGSKTKPAAARSARDPGGKG